LASMTCPRNHIHPVPKTTSPFAMPLTQTASEAPPAVRLGRSGKCQSPALPRADTSNASAIRDARWIKGVAHQENAAESSTRS